MTTGVFPDSVQRELPPIAEKIDAAQSAEEAVDLILDGYAVIGRHVGETRFAKHATEPGFDPAEFGEARIGAIVDEVADEAAGICRHHRAHGIEDEAFDIRVVIAVLHAFRTRFVELLAASAKAGTA